MSSILESIDLKDAGAVEDALLRGTSAALGADCRRGSIDLIETRPEESGRGAATLIATGDLHDNPLHLARLVRAAGMDGPPRSAPDPSHLLLHELIHSDRLVNGMDFSYRVLVRIAALKAAYPQRVHAILGNHEIAQATGGVVVKHGVKCVEAFDEALDAAFGDDAGRVRSAVRGFVMAMPLAVRCRCEGLTGDVLCAHSLPAPELMDRFDPGVLDRALTEEDFQPRRGAAHLMSWGRSHTEAQLNDLAARWGVRLFVLGHEEAAGGSLVVAPNAVVLNSDHEHGVLVRMDLTRPWTAAEVAARAEKLNGQPEYR